MYIYIYIIYIYIYTNIFIKEDALLESVREICEDYLYDTVEFNEGEFHLII